MNMGRVCEPDRSFIQSDPVLHRFSGIVIACLVGILTGAFMKRRRTGTGHFAKLIPCVLIGKKRVQDHIGINSLLIKKRNRVLQMRCVFIGIIKIPQTRIVRRRKRSRLFKQILFAIDRYQTVIDELRSPAVSADEILLSVRGIDAQNDAGVKEETEVMPEHVHLLISFKPKFSITDVIKYLKGHSARIFFLNHPEIKKNAFWGGKLWSPSYYVGSVGNMSKETVRQYILNQYDGKGGDSSRD